jgi:alpha-L-fucosidase
MLREIYSRYGPVFEQWFDGAKGSGPGVKPQQYDWKLYDGTVDSLQPGCVIFSDVGPGARWVGNEKGYAGKTNWCTLNTAGFTPGKGAPPQQSLNHGDEGGARWVPAESDVSIRPGWFYSPETNDKVKSVAELAEIYYATVGRNANLILNVPADRRGHIAPEDSVALMGFRKWRSESFHDNLAVYSRCTASDTRGNNLFFRAANLTDGDRATYWAADDGVTTATLTLAFRKPVTFNNLVISEYIRLGQRVKAFDVEVLRDGKYVPVASGTTIGHKRILRFGEVTADHVRVRITASLAPPAISGIGLYKAVVLKGMNPGGETGD